MGYKLTFFSEFPIEAVERNCSLFNFRLPCSGLRVRFFVCLFVLTCRSPHTCSQLVHRVQLSTDLPPELQVYEESRDPFPLDAPIKDADCDVRQGDLPDRSPQGPVAPSDQPASGASNLPLEKVTREGKDSASKEMLHGGGQEWMGCRRLNVALFLPVLLWWRYSLRCKFPINVHWC